MDFTKELQVALAAVAEAARAVMERYASFEAIANAPADITTAADHEAQEIILRQLRRHFPDDALSAEEATPTLASAPREGPRLWIVDPIDGTRGFARKNGEFSLMVALHEGGSVAVGVVSEPARDRLTYAVRGQGCWRRDGDANDPIRCQVTATATLAAATLTQSHSKSSDQPSPQLRALAPGRVVESYSAGIKLALVARGEADIYLNTYDGFHDWDIAAGHVLVSEAGGQTSGLRGEVLQYGLPGAWQRAGLLATNGAVHPAALTALR